jgi:siroheme synthase
MAVATLEPITATLQSLGRDAREPALIVERVGFADERVLAGRLGDIAEQARGAQVKPPALLLIGPTVSAASAPRGAASRTVALAGV